MICIISTEPTTLRQLRIFFAEASHYVITLLSPPYLKSKVCQEEYNLASAMHADASYQTRLIPLLVESVDVLPAWCCGYAPIDCRDMSERSLVEVVQKIDYLESRWNSLPTYCCFLVIGIN